jgi:hypothetical protein
MNQDQPPISYSVMIPGKIVRFLEERANVAHGGTRDRDLVPHGHRIVGWRVVEEGRVLTTLIHEQFMAHLLESLEDNGHFAVTVEEFPAHESYQFKCRYVRHRPVEPEDLEITARVRERFVRRVLPIFPDATEPMLRAFVLNPHVAVECEVLEIYLQTPGPGAGARLVPPAEA